MLDDFRHEKLELLYPCQWTYKVIGSGQDDLRSAIAEVVQDREHTIALSNQSKTGKYCCLNLQMTVYSDESRTQMYNALRNHPMIRIIL